MALHDAGLDAGAAGLPDVATLTRLAAELFGALPGAHAAGGVPVPANPQPPGASVTSLAAGPSTPAALPFEAPPPGANLLPTSPQAPADVAAATASARPHAQAPNGAPDLALQAAPGQDGRLGGAAAGLPHAVSEPPRSGSPFYFLDDGRAAAGRLPDAPAVVSPPSGVPDARAIALPDADVLRTLLARQQPAPGAAAAPGPRFYFLDPAGTPAGALSAPGFDVGAVRRDFPILRERVNGRPLAWFDNAATTQKPQVVIDRLKTFYERENSNIHRAAHELAARATDAYEGARETVRRFIGAASTEEIVFVRGATEAINLVAKSWGARNVGAGDEIVVSQLEHHANIVPWQQLAAATGARLRVIPVDDSGQVLLDEYRKLLNERTKIVSVTQVSNALGTVVPVREIVALARQAGACTLVDGAQSVSHLRVDVRELDADFFVFSGHKVFGPTGIGVLYGKRAVLDAMPPWQGGGNMIADVTFEKTIYHGPPARFEAGTGNIADAVGLGAALEYVERLGIANIGRYEHALLDYATQRLRPIPGVRLVGTARDKASVLSFVLDGHTTAAVGEALDEEGIAVRTGHHCAQPILRRFGLEATVRPSLAFYNTCEEVDRLVDVVRRLARRA